MCKFKIDKITYSKRSLEQHDISKKAFSDKALVFLKKKIKIHHLPTYKWNDQQRRI